MILLALLMALAAFALLALASDRHKQRWDGVDIAWRRRVGWALIALTFVTAFAAWGPVYGAIGGFGLLMLGAGASFLALNLTQR
ncbi:MAG: DUF3325 family protein [Sphingomonas paucimobilis]